MKNMKLFIWDFDGTLLDTYPNITGYLRRALLDFGYDVPQEEILEKMLVTIPGAGHGLAYPVDPERYISSLLEFFGPEASAKE